MPRCLGCGQHVSFDTSVCPYCGTRHCVKCGQKLPSSAESCSYCGVLIHPQPKEKQYVSNKWYLLPILLGCVALFATFYLPGPYILLIPVHSTYGFVGGVVAYLLTKKKDPQKAERFLVVGALTLLIIGVAIVAHAFLAALP